MVLCSRRFEKMADHEFVPPEFLRKFRLVKSPQYSELLRKLVGFLPESRRLVNCLKFEIQGIDTMAHFYVPTNECNYADFTGCAFALFGEFPDPLSGFSIISCPSDIRKARVNYT